MVHSDEKLYATYGYFQLNGKRGVRWYYIVDSIGSIRYNVHISKDPQNGSISYPQYGYRYLSKIQESYIFSTVWIPIFDKRLVSFIYSIL